MTERTSGTPSRPHTSTTPTTAGISLLKYYILPYPNIPSVLEERHLLLAFMFPVPCSFVGGASGSYELGTAEPTENEETFIAGEWVVLYWWKLVNCNKAARRPRYVAQVG